MIIGSDYPKIEWNFLGFEFVEPNAFIGDTLICIFSLYFLVKTTKLGVNNPFFTNWKRFFFIFGISFFLGGLGHLCYNYWQVPGKYASWFLGMLAPYFIEQAMLSLLWKEKLKNKLIFISKLKLALALIAETVILLSVDLNPKPELGMIVPTLTSVLGLTLSLGLLGAIYQKRVDTSFKYLSMSALILVPSALFQSLKLSFHQWFDKNDASHLLLIVSLFFYYQTLKRFAEKV